jgi:hypothetical protein
VELRPDIIGSAIDLPVYHVQSIIYLHNTSLIDDQFPQGQNLIDSPFYIQDEAQSCPNHTQEHCMNM